jgi:hypothetical protein
MHKHVEVLIGRLATDPGLQARFAKQPFEVLHELRLELSEVEIAALVATDPAAFRAFTASLDARLRKATRAVEPRPASAETHTGSATDPKKEVSR